MPQDGVTPGAPRLMHDHQLSSLLALAGLGAFHGINPGMGWLFAVALGLQDGSRRAVWRALGPLSVGHALAVAAVTVAALLSGLVVPPHVLRGTVGVLLVALGLSRLVRHRHPRYGGMRVGLVGLTIWSSLMATAHGAGLMVLPVVIGMNGAEATCHTPATGAATALTATLAHGAGYLVVTAIVAVIVFEKVGLSLLRRAWINVDLIWAAALVVTGVATLVR